MPYVPYEYIFDDGYKKGLKRGFTLCLLVNALGWVAVGILYYLYR